MKIGTRVIINMGCDANKIATVIPMSRIKMDGSKTPKINRGHYKPITKGDVAIEFSDGILDVYDKAFLSVFRPQ